MGVFVVVINQYLVKPLLIRVKFVIIYLFRKVTDYDLLNPNVALCKFLKKKSAKDKLNVAMKQAVINHRFSAETRETRKF